MVVTVKEANKKLCCNKESRWCDTVDCMAWRWYDPAPPSPVYEDSRRGYCGLVGYPESEDR